MTYKIKFYLSSFSPIQAFPLLVLENAGDVLNRDEIEAKEDVKEFLPDLSEN